MPPFGKHCWLTLFKDERGLPQAPWDSGAQLQGLHGVFCRLARCHLFFWPITALAYIIWGILGSLVYAGTDMNLIMMLVIILLTIIMLVIFHNSFLLVGFCQLVCNWKIIRNFGTASWFKLELWLQLCRLPCANHLATNRILYYTVSRMCNILSYKNKFSWIEYKYITYIFLRLTTWDMKWTVLH